MSNHRFARLNPFLRTALIAGLLLSCSTAVAKGTLVYCSEGSPEGFQPQFFTTGTTFDAVSVPMFNRLVEFEIGTTNIVPALAESWAVSPDSKTYTFKLRKGVKFHSNANFKPTRDFSADDVLFSGEYWAGETSVSLGLADAVGDLRSTLRARFGDKVLTPVIAPASVLEARTRPTSAGRISSVDDGDAIRIGERDLQAGGVAAELLKTRIADGDRSPRTVKLKPHRILLRKSNCPRREQEKK